MAASKKKPEIVARFLRVSRRMVHNHGVRRKDVEAAFGISHQTTENWENNQTHLTLHQLQRVADYYGLPAGVILLITRLTASFRDAKPEEAQLLANGLVELANEVNRKRETFARRDYRLAEVSDKVDGERYTFSPLAQTMLDLWRAYARAGVYRPQWPDPS